MKHLGHIEIRGNKVIFVYHELPSPKRRDFMMPNWTDGLLRYKKAIKEYKASKREVEVENVFRDFDEWVLDVENQIIEARDGMSCEAEVNGKALITKIII